MSIDFEHFEGKPLAAGQLSALREHDPLLYTAPGGPISAVNGSYTVAFLGCSCGWNSDGEAAKKQKWSEHILEALAVPQSEPRVSEQTVKDAIIYAHSKHGAFTQPWFETLTHAINRLLAAAAPKPAPAPEPNDSIGLLVRTLNDKSISPESTRLAGEVANAATKDVTTIEYPCGCNAAGSGNLPLYCPTHNREAKPAPACEAPAPDIEQQIKQNMRCLSGADLSHLPQPGLCLSEKCLKCPLLRTLAASVHPTGKAESKR